MPRVVSVYFPYLTTDRIRRSGAEAIPVEQPLAVVSKSGSKRWLSAVDRTAISLGLWLGMPASKAQAMVANLAMVDAAPAEDAATLKRLALWMLRQYSPVVAVDGTEVTVVPTGSVGKAVTGLPVHALRLPAETVQALRTFGVETVGQLSAMPRAPMALRLGPEPARRLDQMFGRLAEPIEPMRTPELVEVSRNFPEPIGAAETIAKYTRRLVGKLSARLERQGLGVRRCDLVFQRVDNTRQHLRAGLAKPVRDPGRISKLLCDRIETIDPGFGIEKMTLLALMVEPLEERQVASSLIEESVVDLAPLVDILGNRGHRLYRVAPVASDVPERSVKRIAPTSPDRAETWVAKWSRPSRLLANPEPIEVVALLPDHPPAAFTWRGKRRKVKRADGPERIFGEWWLRPRELQAVRDYFVVEDELGERFWVYRAGDGVDLGTGSQRWFLHGIFG
ncbi:DNA polymerase Y family protein [Mycoplana sp. BE70]|uniref:DinB/UmuC family translesion DNA polymerase n=1 Tax=Mycoplana sp. BE70 TaxID=2817775 RepID=UPI00286C9ABB|nr:DNA polymerase Y family protein [Mycoplana sp. BE70]